MRRYAKFLSLIIGAVLFIGSLAGYSQAPTTSIDFRPDWDTTRVLINPLKGWYHHILDNGIHRYAIQNDSLFDAFPGMDHLYIRLAWSFLEPQEGIYDWSRIDSIVDQYVAKGMGISFRITSKERGPYPTRVAQEVEGVQYATPYWVREAGAQGTVALSRNSDGVYAWSPDWDDPIYLEKLDNFHRAFAKRYGDKPWLRYVDIGSIGDYGEGHTAPSTKVPPSVEEVKANMDVYLRNYPNAQIVATDALLFWQKSEADTRELFEYAASKGITIRDDSPLYTHHLNTYLDTWSISHPYFYEGVYKDRFTVLELQHYHALKRDSAWLGQNGRIPLPKYHFTGEEIFRGAIKTMHATYLGYHGYLEEFWQDNPDIVGSFLNLCGYWYFPIEARVPTVLHWGENEIAISWLNKGVAPAYQPFELHFRLESTRDPSNVFDVQIANARNTNWLPGKDYLEKYVLSLPSYLKKEAYKLKVRLHYRNQPIDVGLRSDAMDELGYLQLGTIRLD